MNFGDQVRLKPG